MYNNLSGRVALITGAGQGVGRGIARQLALAGATVVINDLYPERVAEVTEELALLSKAIPLAFDVTDQDATERALASVVADVGAIDILVHNAGIAAGMAQESFLRTPDAKLRTQLELNTLAAASLFRAVLPGQVERGWGRIIQISSGAAARGLSIGVSAYAASKAATESLIRHIAVEYGPSGITANALSLGLMDNVEADGPALQAMIDAVPVRALGTPDEVGAAAVWLSSDLGGFVTGQVIHLNGGSFSGR